LRRPTRDAREDVARIVAREDVVVVARTGLATRMVVARRRLGRSRARARLRTFERCASVNVERAGTRRRESSARVRDARSRSSSRVERARSRRRRRFGDAFEARRIHHRVDLRRR
jgi:hypothetical protein